MCSVSEATKLPSPRPAAVCGAACSPRVLCRSRRHGQARQAPGYSCPANRNFRLSHAPPFASHSLDGSCHCLPPSIPPSLRIFVPQSLPHMPCVQRATPAPCTFAIRGSFPFHARSPFPAQHLPASLNCTLASTTAARRNGPPPHTHTTTTTTHTHTPYNKICNLHDTAPWGWGWGWGWGGGGGACRGEDEMSDGAGTPCPALSLLLALICRSGSAASRLPVLSLIACSSRRDEAPIRSGVDGGKQHACRLVLGGRPQLGMYTATRAAAPANPSRPPHPLAQPRASPSSVW